jgi:hypothetical protein
MAMPLSLRPGRRYTLQEFERLREAGFGDRRVFSPIFWS